HAIGDEPIARRARSACQIVPDDPVIIFRHVRELRTPRAFADGPDVGCARLQSVVDANEAMSVQVDASLVEADVGGVRDASCRDQDVAALNLLFTGGRAHHERYLLSGSTVHTGDLGAYQEFNLLTGENPLQLIGDVGILAAHEPRPVLDHSHAAAEAP